MSISDLVYDTISIGVTIGAGYGIAAGIDKALQTKTQSCAEGLLTTLAYAGEGAVGGGLLGGAVAISALGTVAITALQIAVIGTLALAVIENAPLLAVGVLALSL